MKKPVLGIETYASYVFAVILAIFAVVTFQGRDFTSMWMWFAIFALILSIVPTVNYIRDLLLWKENPEAYEQKLIERRKKKLEVVQKNIELKKIEEEKSKRQHEAQHLPCCPNCGAWNTKRITTTSRAVSALTIGVASGKIGKQYQCNVCKHMW